MSARPWERRYPLLVGLTATAGTLDALAFLHLGKVFNSFQSGDVLFLGLGVGGGDGGLVVRAAAVLAAFVLGAAVGAGAMGIQVALSPALKIPNVLTVALTATLAYFGQRLG